MPSTIELPAVENIFHQKIAHPAENIGHVVHRLIGLISHHGQISRFAYLLSTMDEKFPSFFTDCCINQFKNNN
uniref:Uncharacterized protein n=1 Tax=Romanomermis culicivorax TaxID=13658 RepID=A0A915K0E7_ROMCU